MLRRLLSLTLLLLVAGVSSAEARSYDFGTIGSNDGGTVSPHALVHEADAVRSGHGVKYGRELTPLLKELSARLPALHGGDRTRAERLLTRPTIGETADTEDAYTVREHGPPLCSQHFCIHWVDTTVDAPPLADANHNGVPDYVETMDGVFEHVYDVENGRLAWRAPKPDGGRGGNDLTDVYIKDLGGQGIYGYSAPDPGQRSFQQSAYLVMENDYSPAQYPKYGGDPLPPMEVTAAHEYNHVLQFAYDYAQDTWMFEATAVWMEDKVYTDVNDYLQYMVPWAQLSFLPITQFNGVDQSDPYNIKVYGDAVLNRWIDAHFGQDTVRNAWERSLDSSPKSFGPGAYDLALRAHGSSFFDAFAQIAAGTAEWRDANSDFAEGASFPDMQRVLDRRTNDVVKLAADRGTVHGRLSHTSFGLVSVAPANVPRIKLVLNAPHGPQMAAALVCRVGDEVTGTSSVVLTRIPQGGPGIATLDDPGRCSRITGVLINADGRTTGSFLRSVQDWAWRSDDVPVLASVSTDFTPPSVQVRSPRPGQQGVPTRSSVKVTFSERVAGLDSAHVLLIGPGGRRVKAKIRLRGSRLEVVPARRLRRGVRYTVRLSSAIEDSGGNALPAAVRSWTFQTGR